MFTSACKRLLTALALSLALTFCFPASAFNIAIWPGDDASIWAPPLNLTNVVAISGGDGHAMALRADGTVVSWSSAYHSEIAVTNAVNIASGWCHDLVVKADGTVKEWGCTSTAPGTTPMPADLTNAIAAAGGDEHSIVLKSDGTCVSWGWMTVSAGYVPAGLSNVVAVAAGFDVSAALKADGTVVNWGYTGYGGTAGNGMTGVSAIAMGHSHGLALRTNGTVAVWGGTISPPPVALTNVVKIGAKQQWACALQADGTLVTWGSNLGGQLNSPDQPLTNVIQLAPMNWAGMLLVGDGPPQPLWRLSNTVAVAESTVVFKGEAVGTEPLAYQWFFNGTAMPGRTTPTLTLTNIQPEQAGSYVVVVSNAFGVRTNSGAEVTTIPANITVQPTNQTAYGGDSVTMNVAAEGAGLMYQWKFCGTNLIGETNTQLVRSVVTTNEAGIYSVIVSNSYGLVESSNAALAVVPIVITNQPTNLSRYVGDFATFAVAALKNGPFSYQWRFNGTDLPDKTGSSLTVGPLAGADAGSYSVLVSNPYGSVVSTSAILSVANSKPIITSQPVSRGIYHGGNASFQVVADGSKPLFYQWRFNGTDIPDATGSTLSLTNPGSTNAGKYSVLVSNAAGSTLSSNAILGFLVVVTWGNTNSYGLGNLPADLTNVLAVCGGDNHSAALKSDGCVVAWGYNYWGQTNVPASLSNVVAISAALNHTVALKSNGTVVAWGSSGTTVPAGLSNVISVAAGDYFSLALKTNGTVAAWGDGAYIGVVTNVPANVTNVVAITAGGGYAAALKADGTVVAWGSSPPSTSGMTNVVAISANEFPLLALKADGKVVAAGVAAPPASLSNVVGIAAGRYHALALRSDGTATNWSYPSGPATPVGLSNVVAIASGQNHCLAIIGNGPEPVPFAVTNLCYLTNRFSCSVPSRYGRLYSLEYKDSLVNAVWKPKLLNLSTGTTVNLGDGTATNPARFYRIRQW